MWAGPPRTLSNFDARSRDVVAMGVACGGRCVIAKAHELGLMNLHVPEEFGGPGLGCFDGMLVGEELYWGCAGIGTSISANGLGAGPVIGFGSDEQKRAWLTPLIEQP